MNLVHLRPSDNIAVAARPLEARTAVVLNGRAIAPREAIPLGHKLALQTIARGAPVRKYGQVIGFATREIAPGEWVHTHNCEAGAFERDYAFASELPPDPEPIRDRAFLGYRRPDGRAGTRNYLAVISTVNCSASTSKYIAEEIRRRGVLRDFPNVDGIVPITHKGGCAMQFGGPDHLQLERTLAGFARHANVAGYLIVGLGCETGQALHLIETQGLVQVSARARSASGVLPSPHPNPPPQGGRGLDGPQGGRGLDGPRRPAVLSIQEEGGIGKTVEAGVRAILDMLPAANDARRVPIPASELIVGLECGGSDGNSGVTANPALGVASDMIVACGGTAILSETPEIYGAEHLLTRRARTREIGEKLVERIRWWEWYTRIFGAEINNNPSPGNKEGGLTTIYEKSLGAIAKGGSTALSGVFHYAEPVTTRGLVVMDTPGYDPVSITGMVAGGANVCCFTTGRGSCFGCKPVPSIKIATNTPMYRHMEGDMDVNAGVILEGTSVAEVGRAIFEEILAVASGKKTKSEQHGVGEEEFAPWSIGPTL